MNTSDHLTDKDFFKQMKKQVKEHSEDLTVSFPIFCLQIFWDLSEDELEDAVTGLKTNDDSIDAFFVKEDDREMHIIQCKSCQSYDKLSALKKE